MLSKYRSKSTPKYRSKSTPKSRSKSTPKSRSKSTPKSRSKSTPKSRSKSTLKTRKINTTKSIFKKLPKELLQHTLSYIEDPNSPPKYTPSVHFINTIEGNYDAITPINISSYNKLNKLNNFDIVINTKETNKDLSIYFYKNNFIYPSVGYPGDTGSIPPWVNIRKEDCGYSYFEKFIDLNTNIEYSLKNTFTPFIKNHWDILNTKIEIVENKQEVNNYYNNNFNDYDDYDEYDEQYSEEEYNKLFVKKTITRKQDKATAFIYHPVYIKNNIDINNIKQQILYEVNKLIILYFEIQERDYYYEDDEQYINSIYLEAFDKRKFKLRQTKWNINSGEYEKFNPIIYN